MEGKERIVVQSSVCPSPRKDARFLFISNEHRGTASLGTEGRVRPWFSFTFQLRGRYDEIPDCRARLNPPGVPFGAQRGGKILGFISVLGAEGGEDKVFPSLTHPLRLISSRRCLYFVYSCCLVRGLTVERQANT